jgi:hypothetical protein
MLSAQRSPIVTGVVLGALFLYCLNGAIFGDLVFYVRNGPNVHLHGLTAWLVTLAPVLVAAAFSVRAGGFEFSDTTRRAAQLGLMIAGAALFVVPMLLAR